MNEVEYREIEEAISVVDDALYHLESARKYRSGFADGL